jgi:hypothetical protein
MLPRRKDVKERVHGREKTTLYGDRALLLDEQRLLPNVGKLVQSGAALSAVLSVRVRIAAATAATMLPGAILFLAGADGGAGAGRATPNLVAPLTVLGPI